MKRAVGLLSAVLVLGGLVLAFWILNPLGWGQENAEQTAPTSSASAGPGTLPDSDAQGAAEALSGLTDNPADGISAVTKESFDAEVALPEGSSLVPEVSSWASDGFGGGTMNVVMSEPGRADTRYVAVMVKEDGQWKLLGTLEQTESPQGPAASAGPEAL
ncbi:hypothetical protein ACLRGI_19110 [Paenarthrobacter nitroguajacolicus]|uniref:hypothetical protein n=1 Tax=Paenarthrobacter nitroguajacolicus TaxID=211146 RepID=UPI003AEB5B02